MNISDIKKNIFKLIKTVLNLQYNVVEDDLNENLPEWDSLKQLSIVFALEEEFDIKLKNDEIEKCTNYYEVCNIVIKKINE